MNNTVPAHPRRDPRGAPKSFHGPRGDGEARRRRRRRRRKGGRERKRETLTVDDDDDDGDDVFSFPPLSNQKTETNECFKSHTRSASFSLLFWCRHDEGERQREFLTRKNEKKTKVRKIITKRESHLFLLLSLSHITPLISLPTRARAQRDSSKRGTSAPHPTPRVLSNNSLEKVIKTAAL